VRLRSVRSRPVGWLRVVPRACALWLVCASALAEEPPARTVGEKDLVEDDGYVVRLSLLTEKDFEAWAEPGFQLSLGYGQGRFTGHGPASGFSSTTFTLRPRVRLDEWWSLGATFAYSAAGSELFGLRWSATLEPTFHPWAGLAVALGLGYGGLDAMLQGNGIPPARPPPVASHQLPADVELQGCEGGAGVGLLRVEYQFVAGSLFATGPYAQADLQWTRCRDKLWHGDDLETGLRLSPWQWWLQHGTTIGWWLSWR
jgi:hypothetical protein